jgi:hypothetical protein
MEKTTHSVGNSKWNYCRRFSRSIISNKKDCLTMLNRNIVNSATIFSDTRNKIDSILILEGIAVILDELCHHHYRSLNLLQILSREQAFEKQSAAVQAVSGF